MQNPILRLAAAALLTISVAAHSAPANRVVLPDAVIPEHYRIDFTPDIDKLTFKGTVEIDLTVKRATDRIVLNAADLVIDEASLSGEAKAPAIGYDDEVQTATFTFDHPLGTGAHTLRLAYHGTIYQSASGLFALEYQGTRGKQHALFTQFENSDARRFVPCWDEPGLKATFVLSATMPAGLMPLSNMPVAATKATPAGRHVTFAKSPKMSTYLLFFGAGDFERVHRDVQGVDVGIVVKRGDTASAAFALDAAAQLLPYYNDYFGVPYPLPKLDLVAGPGASQFFGAMENWGAIFYFEKYLLIDSRLSTQADRQDVYNVVAHEMAHQWFGDLVTMAWWDDLWLNEGFATWMEGRTTRKLHPEWDIDGVDAAYTSRGAMGRDAYATTHPVVQHVETVEQASQAFDGITYGKGSAVIGMLEDYVGADAWREGVRSYIRKHAYGNAVTDDLWREVDQAAPGRQLMQVAHDFTLQPGVPLIKASAVCEAGATRVVLEQGEFTVDRPDKTPLRWHVPVSVRGGDGSVVRVLVDGQASATLPGCGAPVVVNAGQKGYYRTLYAPLQFRALRDGYARLPVVDQLGVMLDASALAQTGLQPEADLLDLADQVPLDASPDLWQLVAGVLGGIDEMFKGQPERQAAFRKYALSRLSPKFEQLGWESREGDSSTVKDLRTSLIGTLSGMGDAKVVAEARRRFAAAASDPAAMPPDLRNTVLDIVAYNADAATWDKLHAMARGEQSSMIRDQYYGLLARAKDKALAQRALDMALTDEPGATNGAGMISAVSWEHPDMAFDFAVAHREQVDKLVDTTSRARYYPGLGSGANDLAMVDKIRAFADAHIAPTSRRSAETAIAAIQTRLKLRALQQPQVEAWLRQKG